MIGIFDSGYGGLTIMQALRLHLPDFEYVYLGDNARAPYGVRTTEEIYELTRDGVAWLFARGAAVVILACNTASANALKRLQKEWLPKHYPDRRVLGILVPTVEAVTGAAWKGQKVVDGEPTNAAIFATPATVASHAYAHEIAKRNPAVRVVEQACPSLVPLIEQGAHPDVLKDEVAKCVDAARAQSAAWPPDVVILGCTHYALIADMFKEHTHGAVVYAQGDLTAEAFARYLERHPDIRARCGSAGTWDAFTTGDAGAVSTLATHFFHAPFTFAHAHVAPHL